VAAIWGPQAADGLGASSSSYCSAVDAVADDDSRIVARLGRPGDVAGGVSRSRTSAVARR
jgi:hypothetical protein